MTPRLSLPLHASFRQLRLGAPSSSSSTAASAVAAVRRLAPRQVARYSTESPPPPKEPAGNEPEETHEEGSYEDLKPFQAPYHMPHQYARVQRPAIIEGKVPRTTFDTSKPASGRFTAENANLSVRPLDVRQREAFALDLLKPGEQLDVLSPGERKKYWKALADGELDIEPQTHKEVEEAGDVSLVPMTQEEIRESIRESQEAFRLMRQNQRWTKEYGVDAAGNITGQRIYLPNIVFRLIPNADHFIRPKSDRKGNHLSNKRNRPIAMEAYNPYIATFRVPTSLNKIDIKGYLKAVYNLDTTFVNTAIQHKTRYRNPGGEWINGKSKDNYKRAVVGLTRPFYYPQDPEGMTPNERKQYEDRLETDFLVKSRQQQMVEQRRVQFANARNTPTSESTAKIYQTQPATSLKHDKPQKRREAEKRHQELVARVHEERKTAEKEPKEDRAREAVPREEAKAVAEDDWRSRS